MPMAGALGRESVLIRPSVCHALVSCGDAGHAPPAFFLGLHAATGSEAERIQIQIHPCKRGEVEPGSPALTLSYVPPCSSGSPLFPDCLFSKLNYANTSQPSFHGNHISRIPQPVLWQKKPTQVTTTNKDKWQEGFPVPWAISLCQY